MQILWSHFIQLKKITMKKNRSKLCNLVKDLKRLSTESHVSRTGFKHRPMSSSHRWLVNWDPSRGGDADAILPPSLTAADQISLSRKCCWVYTKKGRQSCHWKSDPYLGGFPNKHMELELGKVVFRDRERCFHFNAVAEVYRNIPHLYETQLLFNCL